MSQLFQIISAADIFMLVATRKSPANIWLREKKNETKPQYFLIFIVLSLDSLFHISPVDIEAFETRNLINRSPVENRNSEAQNSSESTGTRSFTGLAA